MTAVTCIGSCELQITLSAIEKHQMGPVAPALANSSAKLFVMPLPPPALLGRGIKH